VFERLLSLDPYSLETLDTYSNILFVKEQHASLSYLAYKAWATEKFSPVTCIIIGNYFSLKFDHAKAGTLSPPPCSSFPLLSPSPPPLSLLLTSLSSLELPLSSPLPPLSWTFLTPGALL